MALRIGEAMGGAVGAEQTRLGQGPGIASVGLHLARPRRVHGREVRAGDDDLVAEGLETPGDPPLPGRVRSVVAPLLAVMRHLNQQLVYSDATIKHLGGQDPRVPRLGSVPGVGPVTAAAFLAAIDDAPRFPHAHQLEAYLGLVPASTARARPSKAGHSRVRWLLIQAARSILRCRPPAVEALWTLRIAARQSTRVAVVALARRLAGILYALLRDGTVYAPRRPAALLDPVTARHA